MTLPILHQAGLASWLQLHIWGFIWRPRLTYGPIALLRILRCASIAVFQSKIH